MGAAQFYSVNGTAWTKLANKLAQLIQLHSLSAHFDLSLDPMCHSCYDLFKKIPQENNIKKIPLSAIPIPLGLLQLGYISKE
tara:strand:+ start:2267 stop:2512 length:246 start_codon:yes stop_codon:yes gene_type:complete